MTRGQASERRESLDDLPPCFFFGSGAKVARSHFFELVFADGLDLARLTRFSLDKLSDEEKKEVEVL